MKRFLAAIMAGSMVLLLLSGCSSSGEAKEQGKYRIGIVQHVDHPSLNQIRESITRELEEMVLEEEIEITHYNANGDMSLLQSIMQNLIGEGVDMIVPIATPTAQAALSATSDISIVFSAVSNPVEAGLVSDFSNTDGNITGVSNSIPVEDIFRLSKELTPEVGTYGFIYNSSEINSLTGIQKARAYCEKEGLDYREVTITGTADLYQAVSSLVGQVDAFFTPNDNTVASAMATYVQIAGEAGIPIYVGADSMVIDGGLATVGIDYTFLGQQTARMIGRIMAGESIKENPVEQISEYAKVVNKKTADDLGIRIPESLRGSFVIID